MQYDVEIRRIIRSFYDNSKPDKIRTEGVQQIKEMIWRNGGLWKDYKGQIYTLTKEVQNELYKEFTSSHSIPQPTEETEMLIKVINRFSGNLNDRQAEIFRTMQRALETSISDKKNWEDLAREMLRKIKLQDGFITTEIETTKAALDNLGRFNDYKNAGIEKLIYDGPEPQRQFCVEHHKKIYTLDEVKRMLNDFEQPAWVYCGGFNCKHRWDSILK